ncbi:MAG: hypothetical protein DRZ82_02985 [Thermoprotei archaeon]|nr:MAG: hypothetical protein DRZ82_02985 [Thermoprotei archaeon]
MHVIDLTRKPSYKIENVVASVNLHQRIDLNAIAENIPNTEYNPEQSGL